MLQPCIFSLKDTHITDALLYPQASNSSGDGQFKTKLDRADNVVPLKKVDTRVGEAITTARQKMVPKCSQKELAIKCNVKQQEMTNFEGGKVLPNPQVTSTLERILKVHLTGASIGETKEHKGKGDSKTADPKADPKAATKTSAK